MSIVPTIADLFTQQRQSLSTNCYFGQEQNSENLFEGNSPTAVAAANPFLNKMSMFGNCLNQRLSKLKETIKNYCKSKAAQDVLLQQKEKQCECEKARQFPELEEKLQMECEKNAKLELELFVQRNHMTIVTANMPTQMQIVALEIAKNSIESAKKQCSISWSKVAKKVLHEFIEKMALKADSWSCLLFNGYYGQGRKLELQYRLKPKCIFYADISIFAFSFSKLLNLDEAKKIKKNLQCLH